MNDWDTCTECKRKVWRTIKGKCEECLGIVSPLFSPPIPLSETYLDILTGVRLEVQRDTPGQAVFSLFWSEDSDNVDEINAAIQRLLAQASKTPPKPNVK
jgi:hypothetical protein